MELTIGNLARAAGCRVETVRYYERIGLLPAPPRSRGGHRLYARAHAKRLVFVRRCREFGFGVDQIRELLTLVDGHRYTCDEVREVVLRHRAQLRSRLRALRAMERALGDMATACTGRTVPAFPFIVTLSEGGAGTGDGLDDAPA